MRARVRTPRHKCDSSTINNLGNSDGPLCDRHRLQVCKIPKSSRDVVFSTEPKVVASVRGDALLPGEGVLGR
jgi:hypothetical protein